jgi:Predicted transmembrane transcriptional regulator (anti-sigma factor)
MRYFDGDLPAAGQEEFQPHLRSCPDCYALFEDLRSTLTDLKALPALEPPAELTQNLLAAIGSQGQSSESANGRFRSVAGFLAIILSLLTAAAVLCLNRMSIFDLLTYCVGSLDWLAGITLNFQILFRIFTGLFSGILGPLFRNIGYLYLAGAFIALGAAIRLAMRKLDAADQKSR